MLCSSPHIFVNHCPVACTHTSQRLGAGGGYDTVQAGHKRSYSHCTFRGATPPLAPNRQLYVGLSDIFTIIFHLLLIEKDFLRVPPRYCHFHQSIYTKEWQDVDFLRNTILISRFGILYWCECVRLSTDTA